ncbi:hypothetical protein QJS83_13475 [Bdellovibrio sp. 22V]|uniref:hypothetical protein n=1 Tax=Bdellovibrio TaxID=958 RepID=UPI002543D96C|nr:hypothetical protein [Bdellovibrio sp. 22V]WII71474.1 hypothetical protein QJS83_13475 [Bdellovibrio sp. 22V]
MFKKILAASALVFSVSTVAHANEVVVTCRGSVLADMSTSENYTISITDFGDVLVEGQYKNSRGLLMRINVAEEVVKNDGEGLVLMTAKKRLGMTYSKQAIEVDYRTGKGEVRDYQMLNSALKAKVVYLSHCQR